MVMEFEAGLLLLFLLSFRLWPVFPDYALLRCFIISLPKCVIAVFFVSLWFRRQPLLCDYDVQCISL